MNTYTELRHKVSELIRLGNLEEAFQVLEESTDLLDAQINGDILLLTGKFNKLTSDDLLGLISQDDYQVSLARISRGLLYILGQIREDIPSASKAKKRTKEGFVLHDIPTRMPVGLSTRVVVRLSDDEEALLKRFEATDNTVIESVRIAETMVVELLPFNSGAFEIGTFNEKEQFLEDGEYTQWMFNVKPLLEGAQTLILKVAVLEKIDGEERRKEIVLEREVEVITDYQELPEEEISRPMIATAIKVEIPAAAKEAKVVSINKGRVRILGAFMGLAGRQWQHQGLL